MITAKRWNEAPDILGVVELAAMLGITANALSVRVHRKRGVPTPRWQLACGPVWAKEQFQHLTGEVHANSKPI